MLLLGRRIQEAEGLSRMVPSIEVVANVLSYC